MRPLRVFLTGAASGVGRALAIQYATGGAILGLVARRRAALLDLAQTLHTCVDTYDVDVRDRSAMREAAGDFVARHNGADIVIANAGISLGASAESRDDLAVLDETLAVNVAGVANTLQPFIRPMRAAGAGKLVGIASVAGYRGLPGSAAYCASKAAAISYLESLRLELRGSGVRVTTVCPGYIATPMTHANPYAMPFLMNADEAARRIARVIRRDRSYAVIPWQMALVARMLRVLPNALYDRVFARAPRKPRRLPAARC